MSASLPLFLTSAQNIAKSTARQNKAEHPRTDFIQHILYFGLSSALVQKQLEVSDPSLYYDTVSNKLAALLSETSLISDGGATYYHTRSYSAHPIGLTKQLMPTPHTSCRSKADLLQSNFQAAAQSLTNEAAGLRPRRPRLGMRPGSVQVASRPSRRSSESP